MVQFTLPKNSKITAGKTWTRPVGARNPREYRNLDRPVLATNAERTINAFIMWF
jgi:hypothetical protein